MNNLYDFDDDPLYDDEFDAPKPFWTRRRIALTVFAILILAALFIYSYSGLFIPPPPVPTLAPGSLV